MKPTIAQACKKLDELLPGSFAESWDNVGLIVAQPENTLTGILIALDISPRILQEAINNDCNLIITHHPIWFRDRKKLIGDDFAGIQIHTAIQNKLNLYSYHTNLDNIQMGVNRQIVERLKLHDTTFLEYKTGFGPDANTPAGSGMIGTLSAPMPQNDFLQFVKEVFQTGCIRFTSGPAEISKVAVCGGSGSFLYEAAMKKSADALITGDITYHTFFEPMGTLLLMDIGHYESEQFTKFAIYDLIKEEMSDVDIKISELNTNPVEYYV